MFMKIIVIGASGAVSSQAIKAFSDAGIMRL
jgi:hypothetical protein